MSAHETAATITKPRTAGRSTRPEIRRLSDFLGRHHRLFVLTGAGMSTESGIPDYRDRAGGWKGASPIQHQDFVNELAKRKRYWARSMAGWPPVARARPNAGHKALVALAQGGFVSQVVTQNVDGLHQAAGSQAVIDLHGRLDRVICLACGNRVSRNYVQKRLIAANRDWIADADTLKPDGDVELGEVDYDQFQVPGCPICGGVLKPEVVFFGGSVPNRTVERAWRALDRSDAVLILGSSLMVWSGYRFVREAHRRGLPSLAVSRGWTRADPILDDKLEVNCEHLAEALPDSISTPKLSFPNPEKRSIRK